MEGAGSALEEGHAPARRLPMIVATCAARRDGVASCLEPVTAFPTSDPRRQRRPPLGPPPEGFGAIAKMRLVVMAQGNSKLLLEAFKNLPEADRRTLSEELARTGRALGHRPLGRRCLSIGA